MDGSLHEAFAAKNEQFLSRVPQLQFLLPLLEEFAPTRSTRTDVGSESVLLDKFMYMRKSIPASVSSTKGICAAAASKYSVTAHWQFLRRHRSEGHSSRTCSCGGVLLLHGRTNIVRGEVKQLKAEG